MRIAMIAPLELRVPPANYGGTELIVSLLTEELVRRGHEVTLFATGDSITAGNLVSGWPTALRYSGRDARVIESLNLWNALAASDQFDLLHNHALLESLPMTDLVRTPILTTLHNPIVGDWSYMFARYRGWYNTISHAARRSVPAGGRFAGPVYNGIDPSPYAVRTDGRDPFLLYFGRLSPEKGPQIAIEVARRAQRPLVLAGDLQPKDETFFHREIEPHLGGDGVRYLGNVDPATKIELMGRASGLLAPLLWEEPFGLFMVEAMASGTPVIAFDRGAAREIVEDGATGFVVSTSEEMVSAVGELDRIDPLTCRRRVEREFSHTVMATEYLSLYDRILRGGTPADWAEESRLPPLSSPPSSGPTAPNAEEFQVPHAA